MAKQELNCVTGCLRLELDENKEPLLELIDKVEDAMAEATEVEVAAGEVQRFRADLSLFSADFVRFKKNCANCTNFRRDGKADEYARILTRAKECLENLGKLKIILETKEGASCDAN